MKKQAAQALPMWALAVAGACGIVALFYFGYEQDLLMRVTLGLTAAGLASCLPGLVSIRSKTITAGGAVGVFILVLFADDFSRTINPTSKVPGVSSHVRLNRDQMQYQSDIAAAQFEMTNGNYESALEILDHAKQLNPKEPLALHMIGVLHANYLKQHMTAAEAFAQGYKLGGPEKGRFASNLALSYDAIGDPDSAKKWIQIAFDETPRDRYPALWNEIAYDRGLIHLVAWLRVPRQARNGDFESAAQSFNLFLDRKPTVAHWADYHLACLHAKAAEHEPIKQATHAKATEFFDKFLHGIKAVVGDEKIKSNRKIIRRILALNGMDRNEARGPLEPVECPAIKDAWVATDRNWTSDVEQEDRKSVV